MSDINSYNYEQTHDRKLANSICVAAIAQVIAFDPEKMTVNVQPMSKSLQNGKYESQPPILKVPIVCMRCGGFIFRPWIKVGDTGLVVYLDHDMDSTVTSGKEAKPLTERNHATSDAVFVGGIVSGGYSVKGLPDESHVMAKDDGSIFVAVTPDKVVIKNQSTTAEFMADKIEMNTTDVTINASGTVTIKGAVVNIN
ncbi:MAG: Gp138 family membrane-puncturing spike protein [Oscillospiraceae bacterium]|nr:Gp138 family membrane-puncturing spike protein [Oscillospiraceae bacterium]